MLGTPHAAMPSDADDAVRPWTPQTRERAVITLAQYQTEIEARIAWGGHDHVLLHSNHLQQVRLHQILL